MADTGKRVRNIIFVVVVAIVLFGVIGTRLALSAGVEFPVWTNVGVKESQIEGREYTEFPSLDGGALASGEFQSAFDSYMADAIPLRNQVLFANAALQRSYIAAANALFGFEVYPTFFGSDVLYRPAYDATEWLPLQDDGLLEEGISDFAEGLVAVAASNPDFRFAVIVRDHPRFSETNPALALTDSKWTTQRTVGLMEEVLAGYGNVRIIAPEYASADEYYGDFYKTDHHWNIDGTARAYNMLADAWGLETFDPQPVRQIGEGYYGGAGVRNGLVPLEEPALDAADDFSDLTIVLKNGKTESGAEHSAYKKMSPEQLRYYFYSLYYGARNTSPKIISSDDPTAGVLVSDSYGFAFKRPLARNYGTLYTDSDLHDESSSKKVRLQARIDRDDVTDVVFVAYPENYATLASRMPNYFEQ